jgi:hypothetical protein
MPIYPSLTKPLTTFLILNYYASKRLFTNQRRFLPMADVKNGSSEKGEKKKKTFGQMFMNFLMMGGFIVILIVAVVIIIIVEKLLQ